MSHDIPHDILSENKEHKKDFHLKDIIINNRQSKETGNMGYTRQRQTAHYVLHTNIRTQAQITYTRHEPLHKQMGVKTNQVSFLCGNRKEKLYSLRFFLSMLNTMSSYFSTLVIVKVLMFCSAMSW